jgi:hypothetical protein
VTHLNFRLSTPKSETRKTDSTRVDFAISGFGLLSGFGLRISGFRTTHTFPVAICGLLAHHTVSMTGLSEAASATQRASPLEAFRGTFPRTKIRPLYSAGLGVVAFAMVLLPLIYLALILLACWLVFLHLTNDTWIFSGGSGNMLIRLLVYFGPAVAGGILVFFMIKPFFAAKTKSPDPVTLDPAKEPLLSLLCKRFARS